MTLRNKTDAHWQRIEDRCRVRRLPEPLRRQLRRIYNPCLVTEPLRVVSSRVEEIAAREGLVRHAGDAALFPRRYVPAIHLRRIHRQIMKDEAFVAHVRNEVDVALADANRDRRLEVAGRGYPTCLPDCRPPTTGTWVVRSELGFGLESQLEGKPEGLAVGIAQRTWARSTMGVLHDSDDVGLDGAVGVRALDYGHWGGASVHALAATKPESAGLTVFEMDVVGDPTDSPYVAPLTELQVDARLELVVVSVPPPGDGGSFQYRNRYKQGEQKHAFDMGTVGPKRWRKGLAQLVKTLPTLLADEGEIVFLVPESLRVERNYKRAPQLLEGFRELLVGEGLVVTHDVEVVEVNPPAQPFVGTNRPARQCLIAHRAAPSAPTEERS